MITTKNIREAHPITDLTSPFTLNGYGFRIKVTKKAADKADTLSVTGKLLGSDTAITTMLKSEQWSDEIFKEVSTAVLTNHDIFWGVEFATSYSVHYDLDGGQFINEAGSLVATYDNQITWGNKATKPEVDPTLYDHTFKGWYIVTDGVPSETAFDFENTLIYDNLTITAVYQENLIVTFDSAGGSAVEPISVLEGETITEPTDPTKEGYTFNEWYNGDTLFNFTTPITADITLTAHWLENFTVTFDSQGGSAVTAQEVANGSTATEPTPDPTKDTFTFSHWSATIDGEEFNFTTAITADITLYAVWTA